MVSEGVTQRVRRDARNLRALSAGDNIFKLSRILGHSSVAVTEAHDVHLPKDDLVAPSRQFRIPVAQRDPTNVVPLRRGPGVRN